tara:strand:- start:1802 stop:2536 length:735 start_codon:yes stop_codon:yes gene_type:complete
MPKLTKHYLGAYQDDELVGILTLGWGTNPMGTIKKMFPELSTADYFEIGKMCMDEKMPRNSESQMQSLTIQWMKKHTPSVKFLYTWADGIVGKPGYVYQAANFLYGGFIWSDVYVTAQGEKVHFRTIQRKLKKIMDRQDLKYGPRPSDAYMGEQGFSRIFGKQFRYIYPITKASRKLLKHSTMDWTIDYPKDKDLLWKVKKPGESEYIITDILPYYDGTSVNHNSSNVNKVAQKWGTATLEGFM